MLELGPGWGWNQSGSSRSLSFFMLFLLQLIYVSLSPSLPLVSLPLSLFQKARHYLGLELTTKTKVQGTLLAHEYLCKYNLGCKIRKRWTVGPACVAQLPLRVRCPWQCAMPAQHLRISEQAQHETSPRKNHVTSKSPVGDISVVTLIRTDTTLDHSQKAEKV